jgi:hypothetical protein
MAKRRCEDGNGLHVTQPEKVDENTEKQGNLIKRAENL